MSAQPEIINDGSAIYFASLTALLIVCPVWSIWFLKASSITRVAGYLRVLEDIIAGRTGDKYNYIGWENSYFIYRRSLLKSHKILRDLRPKLEYLIIDSFESLLAAGKLIRDFEKPYQYNILTWTSYFFIAFTCFLIALWWGWNSDASLMKALFVLPAIGFVFTFLYTAGVLSALSIDRSRSMATRERLWRYLLDKRMFHEDGIHCLIHERENEINNQNERKYANSEIIKYCKRKFNEKSN